MAHMTELPDQDLALRTYTDEMLDLLDELDRQRIVSEWIASLPDTSSYLPSAVPDGHDEDTAES